MRGLQMGALFVVMLVPSVAEAQLFPNLPTRKRVRPDCADELPVYGMYRHKYYGYYPTCWRQFPPGWGCPSTEAPDWQAELSRRAIDIPDEDFPGVDDFGDDLRGGRGIDDLLPDLRQQRSPFDLDQPGGSGGSPFDAPSRAPSPFEADPFRSDPLQRPGPEEPDRSAPPSPFDLPETSSSESPTLRPPVTADGPAPDPIASLPELPGMAELAVIPETRPRPIVRSSEHGSGTVIGASNLGPISRLEESTVSMPPQVLGGPFPAELNTSPMGVPGASPGVIGPDHRGAIIPAPERFSGDPIMLDPSEGRPRRRIFSGLFGRRE